MKNTCAICTALIGLAAVAKADLYYVGDESMESLPIRWSVGANLIYDDNVRPGRGPKDNSLASNAFVGVSWINVTPQTSIDIFARLGLIYYVDAPAGVDDVNSQSRVGINVTHRFSERLRWVSRNFVSYELEPDYSYGYANTRDTGEYFYWQTNNSLGFRWTERLATYTGFTLSGVNYSDGNNNDRFTWGLNNQFRYQLTPQTVLTADYRYNDTSSGGVGRDSKNHFALLGVEHRFSPNTIGVLRAGIQHRSVSGGTSSTQPSLEFALNSRVNDQLSVRLFTRYSMESYDTVRGVKGAPLTLVEYDQRQTLRIGVSAEYLLSPRISLNAGIDYLPTTYKNGQIVSGPAAPFPGTANDDVINLTLGLSYRFTDNLFGTLSYVHTDSSSDLSGRDYGRNRVSLGVRAEF